MGWGKIAKKFASDLSLLNDAELIAIASYTLPKQASPADLSVKYIHHTYEDLVKNNEVDVIYIATPHGMHHENALLCLENGKAVLCEKAFALNRRQAEEMVEAASKNEVFLMEAMWTKFLPHFKELKQIIDSGKIGQLKYMSTQFGFIPVAPFADRIFDPKLGGGSLLDIGVYNVFLTLNMLGKPDLVHSMVTRAPTGVDAQCAANFQYQSGAIAQLYSTFSANLATEAHICGDQGRIKLSHRFYAPQTTIEFYSGGMETREEIPFEQFPGWGYQHEALHVAECLRNGLIESPVMSWSDTLLQMEIMDTIRQQAGYEFV